MSIAQQLRVLVSVVQQLLVHVSIVQQLRTSITVLETKKRKLESDERIAKDIFVLSKYFRNSSLFSNFTGDPADHTRGAAFPIANGDRHPATTPLDDFRVNRIQSPRRELSKLLAYR